MPKSILIILVSLLIFTSATLKAGASQIETVAFQLLGGYTVGAGMGMSLLGISRSISPTGGVVPLELSIPPTVVIISSVTVCWIGKRATGFNQSYKWTIFGASVPVFAGIVAGAVLNKSSPNGLNPVLFGAVIGYIIGSVGSPAGAVIGNNLSYSEKQVSAGVRSDGIFLGCRF